MNDIKTYAAPDRLLYCISHDLKTPLNTMMGYAVLLEQQCCDEERVRMYAERIIGSGMLMASMINDVLDYAGEGYRGSASAAEEIDFISLTEEVRSVLEPQIKRKKQNFRIYIDENAKTASLNCDKNTVMRVLTNLLSNAVKYTQENGNIQMIISGREIVIKDDGVGMSPEFVEKVFEPFTREKVVSEPGTGLGMYIVKELVDAASGKLEIKSRPGKGTAVRISFGSADG